MSWLSWIFLESPAALGVGLVALLFLLMVYWRRNGNGRPLVVGAALATALFLLQAVVVTPREHAILVLSGIERELVASRTAALEASLAAGFRFEQFDRGEFIAFVQRELGQLRLHWIERRHLEVLDSAADQFVVRADYQTETNIQGMTYAPRSAWTLTFIRAGDGWLIAEIHCLHIDGNRDLFREGA